MELDLGRLLAVLNRHKVAFVLIGGLAAVYHGSPFPTKTRTSPQTPTMPISPVSRKRSANSTLGSVPKPIPRVCHSLSTQQG